MTLNALVADDEALARSRLRTLLADCTGPAVSVTAEAANAAEAIELLLHQRFDLALLDIHMPGANGLTLARNLANLPHAPPVIFVTAHAEHAVAAFEIEAIDYLTKPVRLERLLQALQKVERYIRHYKGLKPEFPQEFLLIQERGRTLKLPVREVIYFKAELKYITVLTAAGSYLLEGSILELEEKYGADFIRIHRNALVARRFVRALEKHYDAAEGDGWALRLSGTDELLAVSRRQLPAVREAIAVL